MALFIFIILCVFVYFTIKQGKKLLKTNSRDDFSTVLALIFSDFIICLIFVILLT
mgnify:CR=1 FL=1